MTLAELKQHIVDDDDVISLLECLNIDTQLLVELLTDVIGDNYERVLDYYGLEDCTKED